MYVLCAPLNILEWLWQNSSDFSWLKKSVPSCGKCIMTQFACFLTTYKCFAKFCSYDTTVLINVPKPYQSFRIQWNIICSMFKPVSIFYSQLQIRKNLWLSKLKKSLMMENLATPCPRSLDTPTAMNLRPDTQVHQKKPHPRKPSQTSWHRISPSRLHLNFSWSFLVNY